MPASKIQFSEDDFNFIKQYKDAKGISMQRFVTVAVQELRLKLEAEQYIEDAKFKK